MGMKQLLDFSKNGWRKVAFLVAALMIYCLLNFGIKAAKPVLFVFVNENVDAPCTFQLPNPFDPSIAKFHWKPLPLECDPTPALLYVDGANTLRFNEKALRTFDIKHTSDVVCEKREVIRNTSDYDVEFSKGVIINPPVNMTSEFSRITCKSRTGGVLYDNIIVGVVKKAGNLQGQRQRKDKERFNVIMFGLDSVSRSASIRHLSKMRNTLERLGAYDFKGYMKVGENTAPNVIPLLTGRRIGAADEWPSNETLDSTPFLWKLFASQGYMTLMGEDMPDITPFNNHFRGFHKSPAHHYMRPYWLAQKKLDTFKHDMSAIYRFLEDKGIHMKKTSVFCFQNSKKHAIVLNYIRQFLLQYQDEPRFSYTFLTELSHSFNNFLSYGDADYSEFFLWLNETGLLEDTVVIAFSDHGPRHESYRNTFVGRIESRMPFLSIIVPRRLKERYPNIHDSLKINTMRLVTVFDVYQTLVDVLKNNFENPSKQIINGKFRGTSLLQPLPSKRSCFDAGIPEEFCACYKSKVVNVTNNAKVASMAQVIVKHLNNIVSKYHLCEDIYLFKVLSAQAITLGLRHRDTRHNGYSVFRFTRPEEGRERYSVTIETLPGLAQFDATCEYSNDFGIEVIGKIDRVNKYGNQSACLSETHHYMKPFCFCKSERFVPGY